MFRTIEAGMTPNESKIAEIRAALKAEPDNAELWLQLGMEYSQSLFEESIKNYSMAIGLSPFNGEYYFHRGRKYLSTDQYAEALADFHASLRLDCKDGQSWHYLGVVLYYLEQYAEAARYFGKALEMNKKNGVDCVWPEVDWMWMSFMRAGDSQSAKQALDLVADDAYSSAGDMAYKKRVRLYKGVDSIETFMQNVSREDPLDTVTELYGAANYYMFISPDPQKATELLDATLAVKGYENAFGWKCAYHDREAGRA